MMDEFIHWPKPHLLSSTTYDEMLLWMIEIWMKNHSVSDSNCKHHKSIIPPKLYEEQQTMLGSGKATHPTFAYAHALLHPQCRCRCREVIHWFLFK